MAASLEALRQFPDDSELVSSANRMLWNMTKNDANLDEILRLGGEDIIAACMRRFPDDRRLTVCGNVALRNLRNRRTELDKYEEPEKPLAAEEEAGAATASTASAEKDAGK